MKRTLSAFFALLLCVSVSGAALAAPLEDARRTEALDIAEDLPAALSAEDKAAVLSALYEADVFAVRAALEARLVTCREVTEYYLQRIEAYNKPYNCFITLCEDALEQADARDAQIAAGTAEGELFGVPVVVKDNIHAEGYLTTNGRSKKSSAVSEENAAVVERLLEEGAVILAKSNMSTEAQDARTSRSAAAGETKNAYSRYLSAGGSSGGSAAATSLNFCAAALGTDTNSSLRIPAALNGCVALRVTTGLLPRDGIEILNQHRDVPGAITRTVAEQALMLDVLTGGEAGYLDNLDADALNGARIGVLKELTYARSSGERAEGNLCPEVAEAFARAVEELKECGAEVVEVSMPKLFPLSEVTFYTGGYEKIPALTEAFEAFLAEQALDAVIFPTYLSAPLRTGKDAEGTAWNVYEQPFVNNCRTLAPSGAVPEITVPIGYHSLGAGIGMEIAAGQHSEQLLLDLAYSYTERFDHRETPDGAPNVYADADDGELEELTDRYLVSLLPPEETEEEPVEDAEEAEDAEAPAAEQEETPAPPVPPTDDKKLLLCLIPFAVAVVLRHIPWKKAACRR